MVETKAGNEEANEQAGEVHKRAVVVVIDKGRAKVVSYLYTSCARSAQE